VKHAPLFIVILSVALPSCDKSEARRDAEERLRQLTRARVEAKHKADRQNATVADGVEYAQACEAAKAALSDAEHAGLGDAEQIAAQEFEALDRDLTKREAERAEALRAITERWSEEKSRIEADARASKNASIIRAEEDRARQRFHPGGLPSCERLGIDVRGEADDACPGGHRERNCGTGPHEIDEDDVQLGGQVADGAGGDVLHVEDRLVDPRSIHEVADDGKDRHVP